MYSYCCVLSSFWLSVTILTDDVLGGAAEHPFLYPPFSWHMEYSHISFIRTKPNEKKNPTTELRSIANKWIPRMNKPRHSNPYFRWQDCEVSIDYPLITESLSYNPKFYSRCLRVSTTFPMCPSIGCPFTAWEYGNIASVCGCTLYNNYVLVHVTFWRESHLSCPSNISIPDPCRTCTYIIPSYIR